MANVRLFMRKIIEVLRLHHEGGRSHREIARVVGTSPTTVGEILRRAKQCGLTYPLPDGLSEMGLEAQLYPPATPSSRTRPEPDWPAVHREMRRKGVNRYLPSAARCAIPHARALGVLLSSAEFLEAHKGQRQSRGRNGRIT